MTNDLDKLEREVERGMELLRDLPAASPSTECVQRIKAAVAGEAVRVARHRRAVRAVRAGLGLAAALALAIGLTVRWSRPSTAVPEAEATLGEWAAAWDESNTRLAILVERSWSGGDPRLSGDEAAEVDGWLHSLDQSFEHLGAVQGG